MGKRRVGLVHEASKPWERTTSNELRFDTLVRAKTGKFDSRIFGSLHQRYFIFQIDIHQKHMSIFNLLSDNFQILLSLKLQYKYRSISKRKRK